MRLRCIFAIALGALPVACSAGTAGLTPAAAGDASAARTARAKSALVLRVHVPRRRRAHYVSPATTALSISLSGPTNVAQTLPLVPGSPGCTTGASGTSCTLTVPNLNVCPSTKNCYTGSIATLAQSGATLSANVDIAFAIVRGKSNQLSFTLGGVPASISLVPGASSSFAGNVADGFTASKCGTDVVDVFGLDAAGDTILGPGAPVPALTSDDPAHFAVATPPPAQPNEFTLTRPILPNAGARVHLTMTLAPDANSGATPPPGVQAAVTFDRDVCGVLTQYSLPASRYPQDIASGPDGDLWFTEYGNAALGRMSTAGTLLDEFPTSPLSGPDDIAVGPDNELWFTAYNGEAIGKSTTTGTVTPYPIPTPLSDPTPAPAGIVAGPDGNLWFVENQGSAVDQMTTAGAILHRYALSSSATPQRIAVGPAHALWFTDSSDIGTITTTGTITTYSTGLSVSYSGGDIAAGPDGNLWFTDPTSNAIGKITTAGSITEYTLATGAFPVGIAAGPDGALWFTEVSAFKIGRITTDGASIKEYTVPGIVSNDLEDIVTGPDGALWFVEYYSDKIGRLQ